MFEAFLKAKLICAGSVRIDVKLPPGYTCRDNAGPHGEAKTVFLAFGNHRVKLRIGNSSFSVAERNGKFFLLENEREICEVRFLKPVFHAPELAFFNLIPWCKFNCSFCNLPHGRKEDVRIEKYIELMKRKAGEIKSIAITSGVSDSSADVRLMKEFVEKARKEFSLPIGVEPFVESIEQIDVLHRAGADEIKINVHSFDKDVLLRECPAFSRDTIALLEHAVKVFGEGNVATNVLLGLGESRENLILGLEKITDLGVLANLRYVQAYNALSPENLLAIAEDYKKILNRFGLKNRMETMCLMCKSCDIVVGWDL